MRKHIEQLLLIFYVKQHVCRVKSVRGLYTHPYRIFTNHSYTLTMTNMLTVLNLRYYGEICSCSEYVQVEVTHRNVPVNCTVINL